VRDRYDAKGDLVEVKQVTQTATGTLPEKALISTIKYRADRPHYLDEYPDATGHRAVKTEYDPVTGRLKSVTDADGDLDRPTFHGHRVKGVDSVRGDHPWPEPVAPSPVSSRCKPSSW
jgi:hypothetical protein